MPTVPVLLKPLDVLLFRDARPFGAGDSVRSQLPLPQTFVGLVKTYFTRRFGWSSRDWHGHHERPPEDQPWHVRLRFRGPWLFADAVDDVPRGPLVSTPADVVRLGKNPRAPLDRLRPLSEEDSRGLPGWSPPIDSMRPLWIASRDAPVAAGGFLDTDGLKQYLAGDVPSRTRELERFAEFERRTGIGIDPDRLVADQRQGLIYSASFLRLGNGLLVTPGIFSNSKHRWRPRELGTLIAATVPKPLPVSGWDLAGQSAEGHRQRPRATRFAVPAGATYFWQRSERTRQRNSSSVHAPLESPCDCPRDRKANPARYRNETRELQPFTRPVESAPESSADGCGDRPESRCPASARHCPESIPTSEPDRHRPATWGR